MAAARIYQRKWILIRLPIAIVAVLAMAWLWRQWLPLPPAEITFSAGRPDGAYHGYAQRYARYFAERGVTLHVVESEGSAENLARLRAGAAQLAFLQGGTGYADRDLRSQPRVQTLARVDNEAVWIFARVPGLESLQQLQGMRVSLGAPGSDTRKLAQELLEQVRLSPADMQESKLAGTEALAAIRQSQLDAMVVVSSPDSPLVRMALQAPGIHLVQLSRSAALIERLPYLQLRLLPQGALDAAGKVPARDATMLLMTSSLATREDLHPALQRLAAAAARDIHGGAGVFHRAGEFPSLKRIEFPASPHAREVLAHGLPWLERNLPFWAAQVLLRLLVICLPVALVAWWLGSILPAYLRWLVESRLTRWYGELKYIETDLARDSVSGLDHSKYVKRLASIESRMAAFVTPDYLMPRWFTLKQHVEFVRLRLVRQRGR
jgi:TRAP transporter TAXI family solute receptor